MKITGDPLIDLIIWHEATDPYEDRNEVSPQADREEVRVHRATSKTSTPSGWKLLIKFLSRK